MIPLIAAIFLVAAFICLIRIFHLVEKTRDVIAISRESMETVRSPILGDDEKEKALQKNAVALLLLFLILAAGGGAAFFIPIGVLWICEQLGWLSIQSVFSVVVSPVFLITSGVASVFALFVWRGGQSENTDYSTLDRLLHRISFNTYTAQISLADFEDRLFARDLQDCDTDEPLFITALPRAGTTMLLECFAKLPEYASHTYRDMPFVLIPCFWAFFSSFFQGKGELRERAHGDGVLIDFDSPEALEGVLWKAFWPRRYRKDRIAPLKEEKNDEFVDFFRKHMRKIILLRRKKNASAARYLSKNNLNIAHIKWLKAYFPNADILIPFREPLQQASSLLKQHLNFLDIHGHDPFSSEYMAAIGHFDFGRNLRPIDFNNRLDNYVSRDASSMMFWLEYWIAAYSFILAESESTPSVHCVHYESLCENPQAGLRAIADTIGYPSPEKLVAEAIAIHPSGKREVDSAGIPPDLLEEAYNIYSRMKKTAVNGSGL